ncbi:MAG: peptidoglycan DD-metalloendopeptidase family protein [Oscillospiraceae bacterium]|nr:peptidoglycan DD-metalloendopeptidase family protein [Oscillospiraceae bacterium]
MRPNQEKVNAFSELWELLYQVSYFTGVQVLRVIKRLYYLERRFSAFIARQLTAPMRWAYGWIVKIALAVFHALAQPVYAAIRGVKLIRKNVSEAAKIGFGYAIAAFFSTLFGGIKRNGHLFKTGLNYLAPVVGLAVLFTSVHTIASANMMLEVWYEGQLLGYIEKESVYNDAMLMFQQRIIYEEGEEPFQAKPQFRLCMVADDQLVGEEALVDRMVQMSAEDIVEANGIYIGNEFKGAVSDTTQIELAVATLLAQHRTGAKNETVELVRPLKIVAGLYPTKSVVEEKKILDLMSSEVEGEILYTIQAGDTPYGVARANGIAYSEFKAMNPNCETDFVIGHTVYLAKSEPYMAVKVIRRETRKEETAYKTEITTDSSKSVSYTKITQRGKNGITEITEDVEYVNGMEIGRTRVSTKVLQKVVNEKVVRGNKIIGSNVQAGGSTSLNGIKFSWPLNGGRLGDNYGWRGGRMHYGQDIIANRGTEIYAAAAGTVELSRWYSTFGNCVIINHGGGVKTLYAHASRLIATQGTRVEKGQVIALVGTTGWSYGNHLHFELRVNGSRINPRPYIVS